MDNMEETLESWTSMIRTCVFMFRTPPAPEDIDWEINLVEGRSIPYKLFNFNTLEEMLEKIPGLKVYKEQNKTYVRAIPVKRKVEDLETEDLRVKNLKTEDLSSVKSKPIPLLPTKIEKGWKSTATSTTGKNTENKLSVPSTTTKNTAVNSKISMPVENLIIEDRLGFLPSFKKLNEEKKLNTNSTEEQSKSNNKTIMPFTIRKMNVKGKPDTYQIVEKKTEFQVSIPVTVQNANSECKSDVNSTTSTFEHKSEFKSHVPDTETVETKSNFTADELKNNFKISVAEQIQKLEVESKFTDNQNVELLKSKYNSIQVKSENIKEESSLISNPIEKEIKSEDDLIVLREKLKKKLEAESRLISNQVNDMKPDVDSSVLIIDEIEKIESQTKDTTEKLPQRVLKKIPFFPKTSKPCVNDTSVPKRTQQPVKKSASITSQHSVQKPVPAATQQPVQKSVATTTQQPVQMSVATTTQQPVQMSTVSSVKLTKGQKKQINKFKAYLEKKKKEQEELEKKTKEAKELEKISKEKIDFDVLTKQNHVLENMKKQSNEVANHQKNVNLNAPIIPTNSHHPGVSAQQISNFIHLWSMEDPCLRLWGYTTLRNIAEPFYYNYFEGNKFYSTVVVDMRMFTSYPRLSETELQARKVAAQVALQLLLGRDR